ncbi:MAG: hypothetical protein QNJ53_23205, partial [Pleurocapsa sp. MO_192.B19]|nr:hypothetical protein [Pleurocapsa sp. MO_192.B19]
MEKFKFGLFKAKISFKHLKEIIPTDIKASLSEENNELTAVQVNQVKRQIASLTTHPVQQSEIVDTFTSALARWQEQPEGNNNLVILSSPVAPLTKVINELLANLEAESLIETKSLTWQARLHDYRQIKSELLASIQNANASTEATSDCYKLMVISRLECFFLRCIGGLEAIEVLRDLIASDSARFWLIGCNSWAWQYLERIYQISAYLTNTVFLPSLNQEQMQEWLQPLMAEINPFWQADNEWLQIKKKEIKAAKRKHQEFDEVAKIQA